MSPRKKHKSDRLGLFWWVGPMVVGLLICAWFGTALYLFFSYDYKTATTWDEVKLFTGGGMFFLGLMAIVGTVLGWISNGIGDAIDYEAKTGTLRKTLKELEKRKKRDPYDIL